MKILVCISNVPDTTTKIRFVENNTVFDKNNVQWIINPWDELALTRAIQMKESQSGLISEIVVINVGPKETEATLRKALAVGADKAIRVDAETKDASFVAFQLAEAIKDQNFDLIMCGIESSDYNGSLVGGMLAELLGYASVSSVSQVDIEGEDIHIVREIDGGKEKIKTRKPFVAIVQKGIAIEPKIPSMRGIMMARQKPLEVIPGKQTDIYCQDLNYELPAPKAACKIIDPENVQELVHLLHNEAKVI